MDQRGIYKDRREMLAYSVWTLARAVDVEEAGK